MYPHVLLETVTEMWYPRSLEQNEMNERLEGWLKCSSWKQWINSLPSVKCTVWKKKRSTTWQTIAAYLRNVKWTECNSVRQIYWSAEHHFNDGRDNVWILYALPFHSGLHCIPTAPRENWFQMCTITYALVYYEEEQLSVIGQFWRIMSFFK